MTKFLLLHVGQMKQMECDYTCEVLHYLLKDRFGTSLVKLSVDLVDLDNKASLDLLSALFKHRECHNNDAFIIYLVYSPIVFPTDQHD